MFKKILTLGVLVLSACSSVEDIQLPITTTNETARNFYKKALVHFSQGEWPEAREGLQSALRIDPNFVMANLYGWTDDPVQTRKYRETAVANKETVSEAEKIMVEIWEAGREGKPDKRLELARNLTKKYPNSSEAYIELGNILRQQYKFDESIESYEKAIDINPDSYEAWQELAQFHIAGGTYVMLPKEQQDKAKGIKYAEEMIRIRPKSPGAHQLRANLERQYSNFEEANTLYQKMIDVCNETGSTAKSTALIVSAHTLMFSGQLENSMKRYDEAIAIASSPQTAHNLKFYKAVANLFENKFYDGLDVLDEMMGDVGETSNSKERVNGNTSAIYWHKMMMHGHNQQKTEAFKALDQWKKYRKIDLDMNDDRDVENHNASNYATEAWMHALFGEYSKAKTKLDEHYSILKDRESAGALDNFKGIYGMIYVMQGNPEKALEYFDDRIEPANYQYYSYFKAVALKASGKQDEAKKIFEFIANFNFLSWEAGLTRGLSQKELDS